MKSKQDNIAEEYPRIYLYRRIVQAKLFIDGNYAGNIDLNNISNEAYFSKFHFLRLFKTVYGKTPHQYLKYVRVEKAKDLLKNNTSVAEACSLVGFNSITTFSGLFSKTVGETPSAYAMRHQLTKEKMARTPLAFVPGCYAYQHGWVENSNNEEYND